MSDAIIVALIAALGGIVAKGFEFLIAWAKRKSGKTTAIERIEKKLDKLERDYINAPCKFGVREKV